MKLRHQVITAGALACIITLSLPQAFAQVAAPADPQATQAAPQSNLRLQSLVEDVIQKAGLPASVHVYVADSNGQAAADVGATKPVIPASNNKIVTTAAGLTLLGPNYHFDTVLLASGPVSNGTLQGDLVVYGGGDPGIGGRYQEDKSDITAVLRGWATQLKQRGITSISGNIVADDSFFDDVYFHPKWYPSERGEWYEAEVSALAFNDNCIDMTWSGKDILPGEPAKFTLSPKTDYVDFVNEVKIVAKGKSTERYYDRGATSNRITATGTLNTGTTNVDSAAIHDGALYCVTMLKDVLKAQGINVAGNATKDRGAAAKLPQNNILFIHRSVPLLQVCQTINLNSQNFYTECLFKTLGRTQLGQGTYEAGRRVVEDFSKKSGIFSEGHRAEDGSGLSNKNHVTCRQLVETLRFMDTNGLKKEWRSTLPQGQVRGSLKGRYSGESSAKRIFGKTGSIGGVRSLSGYVIDAAGRDVYYSIVLNDLPNKNISDGMKLIDKLAVELAKSK